jgi:serine protease
MPDNKNKWPRHLAALLILLPALGRPAWTRAEPAARDFLAHDPLATNQIIVRLRSHTLSTQSFRLRASQLAGTTLSGQRVMGTGARLYQLPAHMPVTYVRQMAARIAQDPNVLYAEPNVRRRRHWSGLSTGMTVSSRMAFSGAPNDPLFRRQWALSGAAGNLDALAAWRITTGSSRIVIGIVDSGARFEHEDLRGRLIAGLDLMNGNLQPIDTGGKMAGIVVYHGTWIAGVIGAATNNGRGTAGINWISKMLVVRDGDDFGDSLAAATDAILWAAGVPVPGLPGNPTPAQVINYSSGGQGACSQTEIEMLQTLKAKGVVLVVSAGNDGADARGTSPANCPGVISVAAIDANGNRANFSNYGPSVTIAAPGQQIIMPGSTTSPPRSTDYTVQDGTSFSAPMVSGVVSLMLSVNPRLSPDAVIRLLRQSARPFPRGADCSGICQAGMLDAGRAVALAAGQGGVAPPQTLHVLISRAQTVHSGSRVQLIGGGRTTPGARITAYHWQQVGGPRVQLSDPRVARPAFIAPRIPASLVFHLTVTDSTGHTAGAATVVRVTRN